MKELQHWRISKMVKKYCTDLEERNINTKTGEIWNIDDVPNLWKSKVEKQIKADGYIVAADGTVVKVEDAE